MLILCFFFRIWEMIVVAKKKRKRAPSRRVRRSGRRTRRRFGRGEGSNEVRFSTLLRPLPTLTRSRSGLLNAYETGRSTRGEYSLGFPTSSDGDFPARSDFVRTDAAGETHARGGKAKNASSVARPRGDVSRRCREDTRSSRKGRLFLPSLAMRERMGGTQVRPECDLGATTVAEKRSPSPKDRRRRRGRGAGVRQKRGYFGVPRNPKAHSRRSDPRSRPASRHHTTTRVLPPLP